MLIYDLIDTLPAEHRRLIHEYGVANWWNAGGAYATPERMERMFWKPIRHRKLHPTKEDAHVQ